MKKTVVGVFCLAAVLAACPVLGAVTARYLGDAVAYLGADCKGSWVGNVGNDGYHLLYWGTGEGQQLYPPYLGQAQKGPGIVTHQWVKPGSATVERAVQNAAKTERCASAWYSGENPAYIRIPVVQNCDFVLGVYMLDWDQDGGRQAEVSVCDLSEEKSPPWKQDQGNYMEGRWNFVAINAAAGDTISIKLNGLKSNAPAAMLSFDAPAGTRVSSFVITDQTTGSALLTNSATVNVSITGSTIKPTTIAAYLITKTPDTPDVANPNWSAAPPQSYAYTGAQGTMTLYGWVKDSKNAVKGTAASILFNTTVPTVARVNGPRGRTETTAEVSWTTNIPCFGRVLIRARGETKWAAGPLDESATTTHSHLLSGLVFRTTYEYRLENNEHLDVIRRFVFDRVAPGLPAGWPNYRGPNRDGKSTETGLLKQWPAGGPKELWNRALGGSGYSSFSIADGMIYSTGENGGRLFITGIELESGTIKFNEAVAPAFTGEMPGSRSTPTINDGRLYLLSGTGILMCRDAKTCSKIWEVNLDQKCAAKRGGYGSAESVLIEGDMVICTPGGNQACVAAFNKKTGELAWGTKGFDYEAQYASPIAIDTPGGRQIVTVFRGAVMGVSAKDGRHLWHWDRPARAPANITTVLFHDGCIFEANGYGCGGALGRIGQGGIIQLWETKDMAPLVGEVVLVGDYLYGSRQDGGWVCLDYKTGKTMYKETNRRGPITYADGMLYCLDEDSGQLDLVPPVPTGYKPVSSFKLPNKAAMKYWSMPVISGGRLYVRHGDTMFAYDIKQK